MKSRIILTIAIGFVFLGSVFAQHEPFQLAINVNKADSVITAHSNSDHPFIIIDLRTPGEFAGGFIDGAINYNYYGAGFNDTLAKLDKDREYLIYCASGGRSGGAFNKMKDLEFKMVYNMLGGVGAWRAAGYPLVTKSTGITLFEDKVDLVQLYPNPVSSESVFVNKEEYLPVSIQVMNIQGQIVDQYDIEPLLSERLKTEKLQPGIYFYRVFSDGIFIQTGKFLKGN